MRSKARGVLLHDIFDPKEEPTPENTIDELKNVIDCDDISFIHSEGKENHVGKNSNGLSMKRGVDESNAAEVLRPYSQHHAFPGETIKIEERRRNESLHGRGYALSVNAPKKHSNDYPKDKKSQKLRPPSPEVLRDSPSTQKDINPLQHQEFNIITNAPKVRRNCEDLKDEIHIISRMEERKTASNRYGYRTQQRGHPGTSNCIRKSLDMNISESSGSSLTPRYIRLYEIARTKQMVNPLKPKPSLSPNINRISKLPPLPKLQSSSTLKHPQVYIEAGKTQKMMRNSSPLSSQLQTRSSSVSKRSSSAPKNTHNRLYDLSVKKQREGKVRREDIIRSLPKLQSMMRDVSPLLSQLRTRSSSAPNNRHNHLYDLSIKKQREGRARREDIVKSPKSQSMMRDASPFLSQLRGRSSSAPNNRHNRLYDLSVKKQREGRARRENIVKSLSKPQSSSTLKHLQVYEAGKTKKKVRNASPLSSQLQTRSSPAPKRSSSAPNNRHDRLYGLSIKKQEQGRALRENIAKSKQDDSALDRTSQNISCAEDLFKRKRNTTPSKALDSKVLDKLACKLYERGMQSRISLEKKRVVAAYRLDIAPYKSPLLECIEV